MVAIGGNGAQVIERVDLLQFRDDKTIQALEPTTGIYADMVFFNTVDNQDSMFKFSGCSGNNQSLQIEPNSANADVGVVIRSRGGQPVTVESVFVMGSGIAFLNQVSDDDVGGNFTFNKITASPAANDNIVNIQFSSTDDGGNPTNYAQIDAQIASATDGSERGQLSFQIMDNGSYDQFLTMGGSMGEIQFWKATSINGPLNANFGMMTIFMLDEGTAGGTLSFFKETNSPAANDDIGEIAFSSKDDATNPQDYGAIIAMIGNPASGSETGIMEFTVWDAGAEATYLILDGEAQEVAVEKTLALGSMLASRKGTDITSANDATISRDGNYFDITGAVQINTLSAAGISPGTVIILQFNSNPTVKHATAGSGAQFQLAGAADFSATAGDTLTLVYDGTYWRETARAVI